MTYQKLTPQEGRDPFLARESLKRRVLNVASLVMVWAVIFVIAWALMAF